LDFGLANEAKIERLKNRGKEQFEFMTRRVKTPGWKGNR
jgi:hypothetical protein